MKRRRAPRSGGTDQDLHHATWSRDCLRRMDDEFVVAVEVAFRLGLEDGSRCGRTHLCFYDPIAERRTRRE